MRKWGEKIMLKLELPKGRQKHFLSFFKCSFNFKAHAVQSELNKVSISNLVKFRFHSLSSKIEQAFEKMTKFSKKNIAKNDINLATKRIINQ